MILKSNHIDPEKAMNIDEKVPVTKARPLQTVFYFEEVI